MMGAKSMKSFRLLRYSPDDSGETLPVAAGRARKFPFQSSDPESTETSERSAAPCPPIGVRSLLADRLKLRTETPAQYNLPQTKEEADERLAAFRLMLVGHVPARWWRILRAVVSIRRALRALRGV